MILQHVNLELEIQGFTKNALLLKYQTYPDLLNDGREGKILKKVEFN